MTLIALRGGSYAYRQNRHARHALWSSPPPPRTHCTRHSDKYCWVEDAQLCSTAAGNGDLAMLEWAREHGYGWDENTCSEAAASGNLDVLQWMRENSCPWDEMTCYWAARCGRLHLLQWAREKGCPWNESECQHYVSRWLRSNSCNEQVA